MLMVRKAKQYTLAIRQAETNCLVSNGRGEAEPPELVLVTLLASTLKESLLALECVLAVLKLEGIAPNPNHIESHVHFLAHSPELQKLLGGPTDSLNLSTLQTLERRSTQTGFDFDKNPTRLVASHQINFATTPSKIASLNRPTQANHILGHKGLALLTDFVRCKGH